MINFFRKIRQKLLRENRTSKYLLYAVGEILLVVIGILIALQINNWNENRKQNNLEQDYLISLKEEFESNLKEVNRVIKLNNRQLKNARELSTYTGPKQPQITDKKLGELVLGSINSEVQYRPGSGVINEIISSGKLTIFKNKKLKSALASMDGILLRIRFQEDEELHNTRQKILDMLLDEAGIRKLAFDYGGIFDMDEGEFLESNLHLLSSRKFDNLFTGFIFTASYLSGRYEVLKVQIQEIINIIDSQIK